MTQNSFKHNNPCKKINIVPTSNVTCTKCKTSAYWDEEGKNILRDLVPDDLDGGLCSFCL